MTPAELNRRCSEVSFLRRHRPLSAPSFSSACREHARKELLCSSLGRLDAPQIELEIHGVLAGDFLEVVKRGLCLPKRACRLS